MTGRVLVLGSLNVDLVTRVERHPRPGETVLGEGLQQVAGGKGANQAVAAAAAGARVSMVGCVGDDAGGTAYRRRLERLGIDVSGVRACDGVASGHAIVTVADDGENSIVVVPGANDLLDDREVAAVDALGPGDVLLVQLEVPRAVVCTAVRRAAGRGRGSCSTPRRMPPSPGTSSRSATRSSPTSTRWRRSPRRARRPARSW